MQYELDLQSLPTGTYHATVKGSGDSSTIPGETATSNTLFKPDIPGTAAVQLDKVNSKLTAFWSAVIGNNGYRLRWWMRRASPWRGP